MCEFLSLYFDDDGCVIRCKHCGSYQVCFGTTMITLTGNEFQQFYMMVNSKCDEFDYVIHANRKSVVLQTPSPGVYMLLTKREAARFREILELADTEIKALTLIDMFNPI